MDFAQAEQRFHWIEAQRASGQLSEAGYRAELDQLRVYDQRGRLWMPQEGTGQWHVYVDGAWQAATPPQTAPPPPPPQQKAAPPPRPSTARPQASQRKQVPAAPQANTGCAVGKAVQNVFLWAIVFAVIAVVAYLVAGQEVEILYGVALAAGISALIVFFKMMSAYEGRITDIRTVESTSYDEDGYRTTNRTTYAYLLRPDGKTKRVHAHRGWQRGDYVIKRRGYVNPKKVE
ncbi:MAG: hypothetical protein ACP5G7_11080 [Anaerolineae bacterium]